MAEQIARLGELGLRLRPELTVEELEREIAWAHVAADDRGLGSELGQPYEPDPARRRLFWWLLTQDAIEGARQAQYPMRSEYATLLTPEKFLSQVQAQTDLPVELLSWSPIWRPDGSDLVAIGGREVVLPHRSTLESRKEFFAALVDGPSVFVSADRWVYTVGSVVPVPAEHLAELQQLVAETTTVAFLDSHGQLPAHLLTAGLPTDPPLVANTPRQREVIARRRRYLATTGAPPLTLDRKLELLEAIGILPVPGADLREIDREGFYAQAEDGSPLLQFVCWPESEPFGSFGDWTRLIRDLSALTGTPVGDVSTGPGVIHLTVADTPHDIPAEDFSHEKHTTMDTDALDRIAALLAPEGREAVGTGDLLLFPRAGTWEAYPDARRI